MGAQQAWAPLPQNDRLCVYRGAGGGGALTSKTGRPVPLEGGGGGWKPDPV